MSERTFVGFARRGATTRLHVPRRELPIVLVPGIMGSRLRDPVSGALVWNPLGKPFGDSPENFAVDYGRLGQVSQELVPDESGGPDALPNVVNRNHVVADFYGAAIDTWASLATPAMRASGVTPRVYCAGYDWRQDHARSAMRLAVVVERALAETGAEQVILVAHGTGGLVARYYSRALGGEQRVHQLFLLCCPILGAPAAYLQLKRGLRGLYGKELSAGLQGASIDWIDEGAQVLGDVVRGMNDIARGQSAEDAALGMLGDAYGVCCLALGRWLTRRETIYFLRQMPAIYQLLPHALFCREHPNWVLFDPMCTGHAPTGFMTVLPSAIDVMLSATELSLDAIEAGLGTRMSERIGTFLRPDAPKPEELSGRATRNMTTLGDILGRIKDVAEGDDISTDEEEEWDDAGRDPDPSLLGDLNDLVTKITDRFDRVFLDACNSQRLYADIYTGLLDGVELRAVSSAGLALAARFEQMLTLNFRCEPALVPTEMISAVMDDVLGVVGRVVGRGVDDLVGLIPDPVSLVERASPEEEPEVNESPAAAPATTTAAAPVSPAPPAPRPQAYMHPRTWCVSVEDEPTDAGCLLLATDQVSRDDSNLVKTTLIPDSALQAVTFAPLWGSRSGPLGEIALGDGTVPAFSQRPPPELLSRPFKGEHRAHGVTHSEVANDSGVLDFIAATIDASLAEWIRGRASEAGETT